MIKDKKYDSVLKIKSVADQNVGLISRIGLDTSSSALRK